MSAESGRPYPPLGLYDTVTHKGIVSFVCARTLPMLFCCCVRSLLTPCNLGLSFIFTFLQSIGPLFQVLSGVIHSASPTHLAPDLMHDPLKLHFFPLHLRVVFLNQLTSNLPRQDRTHATFSSAQFHYNCRPAQGKPYTRPKLLLPLQQKLLYCPRSLQGSRLLSKNDHDRWHWNAQRAARVTCVNVWSK